MAAYFQLYRKGSSEPSDLSKVDEEICQHMGIEVHKEKYALGWFDSIGFRIAVLGKPLGSDELRDLIRHISPPQAAETMCSILAFLEEHYTSTAWHGK